MLPSGGSKASMFQYLLVLNSAMFLATTSVPRLLPTALMVTADHHEI